jgi:nicotinate-nucleotide adenylyltransferase
MRLGIFGGTFDPVHYGHLLLAESCREQCELDQVWFLPAAISPHKRQREPAPAADRIEMLELALGGDERLAVCRLEIERGGVSFTIDTLDEIKAQHPGAELFFLLGGDSWRDLPSWREPTRICQLARLVVVRRPSSPEPDFTLLRPLLPPGGKSEPIVVEMPQIDLSSTGIRARVASSQSIRYRTPRAVEKYIETHRLYL